VKTTAIIVAAGTGSRFNSDIPKQFLEVSSKPIVVHAIEKFASAPSVDAIVVVLTSENIPRLGGVHVSKPVRIVTGGATRSHSVFNGLAAIEDDVEVVAVHDGARPFVTVDEIERTVSKAKETGAACLVGTVTDTIKSVRGGEISGTLDREKLRRALTPQAFRVEVLRKAFEDVDLDERVTDECFLVEKLGHPIAFVEGSSRNIKITHPEDLAFAEVLIQIQSAGFSPWNAGEERDESRTLNPDK
jgi:2-C-methyl-D-erythritol 4-phosphate cytidylyltransferase